nr:MAG TPA: SCNM1 Zinc-finger of sodium channel modifier 1 [Caudoviricetes sp.]
MANIRKIVCRVCSSNPYFIDTLFINQEHYKDTYLTVC